MVSVSMEQKSTNLINRWFPLRITIGALCSYLRSLVPQPVDQVHSAVTFVLVAVGVLGYVARVELDT
jgi:hypothetical protein